MEECPKCGFIEDPILNETFAGVRLRDMTDDDVLANAINDIGWASRSTLVAVTDKGNSTWRIQTFYDSDDDFNIAVHNGKKWVAAYRGTRAYFGYDPEDVGSHRRLQAPSISDHLESKTKTEA